jgi:hypothetical protein
MQPLRLGTSCVHSILRFHRCGVAMKRVSGMVTRARSCSPDCVAPSPRSVTSTACSSHSVSLLCPPAKRHCSETIDAHHRAAADIDMTDIGITMTTLTLHDLACGVSLDGLAESAHSDSQTFFGSPAGHSGHRNIMQTTPTPCRVVFSQSSSPWPTTPPRCKPMCVSPPSLSRTPWGHGTMHGPFPFAPELPGPITPPPYWSAFRVSPAQAPIAPMDTTPVVSSSSSGRMCVPAVPSTWLGNGSAMTPPPYWKLMESPVNRSPEHQPC